MHSVYTPGGGSTRESDTLGGFWPPSYDSASAGSPPTSVCQRASSEPNVCCKVLLAAVCPEHCLDRMSGHTNNTGSSLNSWQQVGSSSSQAASGRSCKHLHRRQALHRRQQVGGAASMMTVLLQQQSQGLSRQAGFRQTGARQTGTRQTGSRQTESRQTGSTQTGSRQTAFRSLRGA